MRLHVVGAFVMHGVELTGNGCALQMHLPTASAFLRPVGSKRLLRRRATNADERDERDGEGRALQMHVPTASALQMPMNGDADEQVERVNETNNNRRYEQ